MSDDNITFCHGVWKIMTTYIRSPWLDGRDEAGEDFQQREITHKCYCYTCGKIGLLHLSERRGPDEEGFPCR